MKIWKVKTANWSEYGTFKGVKPALLLKFANFTKLANFLYFTNLLLLSVRGRYRQFTGLHGRNQQAIIARRTRMETA